MPTPLYLLIQQALAAHWKTHDNRYPQKVVLTPAQHQALNDLRQVVATGKSGAKGATPMPGEKFMGVPIEHAPATPGVMIAVDGMEIPLQAPPAT